MEWSSKGVRAWIIFGYDYWVLECRMMDWKRYGVQLIFWHWEHSVEMIWGFGLVEQRRIGIGKVVGSLGWLMVE